MSHVVEDGELRRVSPSQLKTFYDCRRKWYYQKVLHIPEPEKPHLALGTAIHGQLEDWYQLGVEPTHDSIRLALQLPSVPPRSDDIIIEEPRSYDLGLLAAGIPLRGRIDVLIPPVDGRVVVLDWKSTSSWNWLKTPEDLARDAQGITYLKYAFQQYPEAHEGIFRHVYIRTKGGKGARAVETDPLDREYIDSMYATLETVVEQMKETARIADVADVPASPTECEKYGGCPYRDICPVTAKQKKSSFLDLDEEGDNVTLAEKIAAKKAAAVAAGINPPDAAKPDPVEKYVPEPVNHVGGAAKALIQAAEAEAARELRQKPAPTAPHETHALDGLFSVPLPSTKEEFEAQGLTYKRETQLHLYVDCFPERGVREFLKLEEEIYARSHRLIQALAAREPNMVPDGAVDLRECKFGSGVAALVADFRKSPPTGVVVASNTGLAAAVLEVLRPLASIVVVGGR